MQTKLAIAQLFFILAQQTTLNILKDPALLGMLEAMGLLCT